MSYIGNTDVLHVNTTMVSWYHELTDFITLSVSAHYTVYYANVFTLQLCHIPAEGLC